MHRRVNLELETIALSPDGGSLAAGGRYGLLVYDTGTFDPLWFSTIEPVLGIEAIAYSPDGGMLSYSYNARDDERGIILQSESGQPFSSIQISGRGIVSHLAFHPAGRYLAIGFWGGSVVVWDMIDRDVIFEFVQSSVYEKGLQETIVAWSPDGTKLAAGGRDLSFHIWEPIAGNLLESIELDSEIDSIAWSPNGTYLAISSEPDIYLWNVDSHQQVAHLIGDPSDPNVIPGGPVIGLAWSPDGKMIASGSRDGRILIWQTSSTELIRVLSDHETGIHSLEWSPDGEVLFSGSYGNKIMIWNPNNGELIKDIDVFGAR